MVTCKTYIIMIKFLWHFLSVDRNNYKLNPIGENLE